MNRVKDLVKEANFSSRAFPTGTEYASWETDEVPCLNKFIFDKLFYICVSGIGRGGVTGTLPPPGSLRGG